MGYVDNSKKFKCENCGILVGYENIGFREHSGIFTEHCKKCGIRVYDVEEIEEREKLEKEMKEKLPKCECDSCNNKQNIEIGIIFECKICIECYEKLSVMMSDKEVSKSDFLKILNSFLHNNEEEKKIHWKNIVEEKQEYDSYIFGSD